MANKFYADVHSTKNCETGNMRYYKTVQNVCTRISKAEFKRLEDNAEGASSFHTYDTGKSIKQSKTLIFFINPFA